MTPDLIVAAMYTLRDLGTRVCLGIRIATPDDVEKMTRLLVTQIRERYPELFDGMKPRAIREACDFQVFSVRPDKRGFPRWIGEVSWWRHD